MDETTEAERVENLTLNFIDTTTQRFNYSALLFELEKQSKNLNGGAPPRRDMLILSQLNSIVNMDQTLADYHTKKCRDKLKKK